MRIPMKALAVLALAALAACNRIAPPARAPWPALALAAAPGANLDAACVAGYRPGIDYFPSKTSFRRSSQLQVEYGPHYKRLRFTPSVDTAETLEFLLVQCGAPTPPHGPNVQVIQVPIQRLVTGNSAIFRALDELGMVERLYGAENLRNATVDSVRMRAARGQVNDMWGYGHSTIEQIMAVKPDVYLSFYSAYPQANLHPRLWELGVRALPQADHLEPHPLGRAEWIKLLALLGNREARADQLFDRIEEDYLRLAAQARRAQPRPRVLTGFASSRDAFETSGLHNQRAQLIRDAGGEPVIDEASSRSLVTLPFELAYLRGADAEAWIGTMGGQAGVGALVAANQLHGMFRAARENRVYAWDKGYTGAWAYPYQDQGMTMPHVALAEAIAALHPDLLAPTDTIFLRKLP